MKPIKPFLLHWMIAGMLALGTGISGCSVTESDAADLTRLLRSTGSGAQERPNPVITAASGTMTGRYVPETRQFSYTLTWNRLTGNPLAMHFHGPASPNEVAPPVITITGFPTTTSGRVSNTVTLSPEQAQQLLEERWYFNIHTPMYPGGEVRGQVRLNR